MERRHRAWQDAGCGKGNNPAPYPTDIYKISGHLNAPIEHYGKVGNQVREAIDQVDDAGDKNTADIFTEVSRSLDKALWFLEAHVQKEA